MESEPSQITRLLIDWQKGNKTALDQLVPFVYEELRKLARKYLGSERRNLTLQPTALIHEAYVRLLGGSMPEWQSRAHFYGVAAHLMRQILVDSARKRRAAKRGGKEKIVPLEEAAGLSVQNSQQFLHLDQALRNLAAFDERKARILELHYFAGLNQVETGEVLGISERTVREDLRLAQAWLRKELTSP